MILVHDALRNTNNDWDTEDRENGIVVRIVTILSPIQGS
jgi:hypothetical protein